MDVRSVFIRRLTGEPESQDAVQGSTTERNTRREEETGGSVQRKLAALECLRHDGLGEARLVDHRP